MDSTAVTLKKAYQLIKAGHKQRALDLLTPIAYAEPENDQVWYLLGFAHTDPAQRIHAFEHVLRIDPTNQPAQKQLAKLRVAAVVAPATKASIAENARKASAEMSVALRWVAGIGGLLLLCLVALVFGAWSMLRDGLPTPTASSIPATATYTPIPAQISTLVTSPTRGPRLSPSPRPSVTPYPRRATLTPIPTDTIPVSLTAERGKTLTAAATTFTSTPTLLNTLGQ